MNLIHWLKLKRVCAWCNRWLGGNPFAKATHTICPKCKAEVMKGIKP